jgi:hypothetical protein
MYDGISIQCWFISLLFSLCFEHVPPAATSCWISGYTYNYRHFIIVLVGHHTCTPLLI